jgi:positive regulator of sigma E activity
MVHFQLFLRLIKSIALLMVLAGLVVAVVFTSLSVKDVFAAILAFVPTGWGVLSVSFYRNINVHLRQDGAKVNSVLKIVPA